MIGTIIINLINLIESFLASIISLGLILFIVLYHHRRQQVHFLLCANTCLCVFVTSLVLDWMTIDTLRADFYSIKSSGNMMLCNIRAFLFYVTMAGVFNSVCLQAASRLCQVVYRTKAWLTSIPINLLIIVSVWFYGIFILLPIIILRSKSLTYLPNENFCHIPLTNFEWSLYGSLGIFFLPFISSILIYSRLLYFFRHTRENGHRPQRSQQRDIIVIRRILIVVLVLMSLGAPTMVVWALVIITGSVNSFTYRLQIIGCSSGILWLVTALAVITPGLINNQGQMNAHVQPLPMLPRQNQQTLSVIGVPVVVVVR